MEKDTKIIIGLVLWISFLAGLIAVVYYHANIDTTEEFIVIRINEDSNGVVTLYSADDNQYIYDSPYPVSIGYACQVSREKESNSWDKIDTMICWRLP